MFLIVRILKLFSMSVTLAFILSGCTGSYTATTDPKVASKLEGLNLLTISPLVKTLTPGSSCSFETIGGIAPYKYDIYTGNGAIRSLGSTGIYQAPIAEGSAVVRVQDSLGASGYATIEIFDTPTIQPDQKTLAVTNKFPFSVLSGKAPYIFSVISGKGFINAKTGEFIAGDTAGDVVLRVADAEGRKAEAKVTVNPALSFTSASDYLLTGSTYGLSVTGGVPPYIYSIASGAGAVDAITGVFTAPQALGTTAVQVVDSFGNFAVTMLNITTELSIDPSSALIAKNSSLIFKAVGGIPPYKYTIHKGLGEFSTLKLGQYTASESKGVVVIRLTDALGHISDASLTITNNLSFSVANLILAVGNSFDISTIVNGGVAPLTYTIPKSQGLFAGSIYTAPNTPGIYEISVYDSETPAPNIIKTAVLVNSELNLLPASAKMLGGSDKIFSASGGVPPYVYTVLSGDGSITNGIYTAPASSANFITLLVTDARANTAVATVSIEEAFAIVPDTKTLIAQESFTFTAVGGSPPYKYGLVSGSGAINSSTGLYTAPNSSGLTAISVEDSAGNKKNALITILNQLSISPSTISLVKNNSITFTANGGAGPYRFSVVDGEGSINPTTGVYTTPSTPGLSTVRVTDSYGSIKDAAVTIYDGISISPFTKNLVINQNFIFTATGGIAPYVFSMIAGVGNITRAGSYSSNIAGGAIVRVTDSVGDKSEATISVNSALIINPTNKNLGINNQFTFSAAGGVPPYAYSVFSGEGTISLGGDYKAPATSTTAVVQVTDAAGNTANSTVTVNAALTINPTNVALAAGGTQIFMAAGGVGPYVYRVISGGGSFANATYTAPAIASGASVLIVATDTLGNSANATIIIPSISLTISSPNSSDFITAGNKTAFPVSGTCSEVGQSVVISASDIVNIPIIANPICKANKTWSANLNLSSLSDSAIVITANHVNINAIAAPTVSVTVSKDGTPPTVTITTPTTNSYVSNTLNIIGACTKPGPINISTSAEFTAMSTCNGNTYSINLDITSFTEGGALIITANHTDDAGNIATPAVARVIKDTLAPSIDFFNITNATPTNTMTYALDFTASGSPTKYCILENSIVLENCIWQNIPLPTSFTVNPINNDKTLSAWLQDTAGNISTRMDSNIVTLNNTPPPAPSALSLNTPTNSPGSVLSPTILVSGVASGYTVKLYSNSNCSTLKASNVATSTTVLLTTTTLTAGSYTFYAKSTDPVGNISTCSSASVTYLLDLIAPIITNVTASGNGPFKFGNVFTLFIQFSKIVNVTGTPVLALNTGRSGALASYVTGSDSKTLVFSYTVMNTDNSSDLTYVATNSLSLAGGSIKDVVGNLATFTLPSLGAVGSLSLNNQVVIDTAAPLAPSNITDGLWQTSLTKSPTINFTEGSDIGGSGIQTHLIQIVLGSNLSSVVKPWVDFTPNNIISGLSLSGNTQYKVQIKAIDNVGNESAIATSDGWTVDNIAPSIPSPVNDGSVGSSTSSPTITWGASTDSASGLAYYELAIGTTPGGAQMRAWTSVGNITATAITGLGLSMNTTYYASVRATDIAGNISLVGQGDGWTLDTTPPSIPGSVDDGTISFAFTDSPIITWTASTDIGGSGVVGYEVAVGTSKGGADISGWTSIGNVTAYSVTELTLVNGTIYYTSVRALDNSGNRSTPANGDGWTNPYLIVSAATSNYNIYNHYTAVYGIPSIPVNIKVTISKGVDIKATSSSTAALTTGTFPIGSNILLINNGQITGRGGSGGNGSSNCSQGGAGGNGGPAIALNWPISIDNTNGYIFAGGGGGGGGAAYYYSSINYTFAGGGGGGGSGMGYGSGGSGGSGYRGTSGTPGGSYNYTRGGIGGSYSGKNGGNGGSGGSYGQNGGIGSSSMCSASIATTSHGGSAGLAGKAILRNNQTLIFLGGNNTTQIKGLLQ